MVNKRRSEAAKKAWTKRRRAEANRKRRRRDGIGKASFHIPLGTHEKSLQPKDAASLTPNRKVFVKIQFSPHFSKDQSAM